MGTIVLYLISLGLFWVASMIAPFPFIPLLWLIKAVIKDSIPTRIILFPVYLLATILLLYLTQYIWSLLGHRIGWFPFIVAIQNFIASRAKMTNANSKNQAVGIMVGSFLFLILNTL